MEDVAKVVGGGTPKSNVPEYWGGDVQWLTPKDLADRPARYTANGARTITEGGLRGSGAKVLPAGTVLLTSRAPVGYVSVASGPIATNQGFKSLILDETQLPEFWYYLLQHSTDYLRANSGGSTFQEISGGALKKLRFAVPPLDEQRRIVDLTGALDDTIAAAEVGSPRSAHSQMLEAWMTRSSRPLGAALGLRSEARAVVPRQRYRILGLSRSGEGFIDRGELQGSDTAYSRLFPVSRNQLVYRKLTAWEGPISVSTENEHGGWVSNEFPVFDIDADVLLPDLLRHMCRWPGLWHRIGQRLVGSVQRRKRLNPSELVKIEVPMPAIDEQRRFCEALDSLWTAHLLRQESIAKLRALRSSLLTALVSGEHKIPSSYEEVMEAS